MSASKGDLKGDQAQIAKEKKKKKKNAFLASISLDDGPAKPSPPQTQKSTVKTSAKKTMTLTDAATQGLNLTADDKERVTDILTNLPPGVNPFDVDVKAFFDKMDQEDSGKVNPLHKRSTMPVGNLMNQSGALTIDHTCGEDVDVPEDGSRSYISVPILPANPSLKDNPDGWCEVILDKPHYEKVIYSICPDFPLPIPQPPKPRQCIKPSSLGGLGMFATTDLKMNDFILAERPLLIKPGAIRVNVAYDENLSQAQMMSIALQGEEESLGRAFSRMLPEAQAAYKSLANSHLEDGSGPILGVSRTNGFGISFEEGGDRYSVTYDKLSRINHSCRPNAAIKFNRKSFAGELRALHPIKAGEEIVTIYCSVEDALAERQKELQKYGFTCSCEVCSSPELEDFRYRMAHSVRPLIPFINPSIFHIPQKDMRRQLEETVNWLKQIEEHGFQSAIAYLRHLQVAVTCYEMLGNPNEAARWATTWFAIEQAINGATGVMGVMVIMSRMAPSTLRILQSRK